MGSDWEGGEYLVAWEREEGVGGCYGHESDGMVL